VKADDRVALGSTVVTSRLGFGCGSLMRLSRRRDRQNVLCAAYDAGIRHFDVAPMYGLGLAEGELGRFAASRRDRITIATKFGILPAKTTVGMRSLQGLARSVINRFPALRRRVVRSAAAFYQPKDFDPVSAEASLRHSLAGMALDYVDILFMHEPEPSLLSREALGEWLPAMKKRGQIRSFGAAGYVPIVSEVARSFPELVEILQHDNDLVDQQIASVRDLQKPLITFSPLSRSFERIRRCCENDADLAAEIRMETGLDVRDDRSLAKVLFSYALQSNAEGVVLFSSLRPERIHDVAGWAGGDLVSTEVLSVIGTRLRAAAARVAEPAA
jgi:D-threo-aldose 1-dehydrogenase